jgi:hypothetical protein
MIGLVHYVVPKPSSYSWAVSLFICRASHPGESSLSCLWNFHRTTGAVKQKRAPGMESPCRAPVWRTVLNAVMELVLWCLLGWVHMWIGHRYTL